MFSQQPAATRSRCIASTASSDSPGPRPGPGSPPRSWRCCAARPTCTPAPAGPRPTAATRPEWPAGSGETITNPATTRHSLHPCPKTTHDAPVALPHALGPARTHGAASRMPALIADPASNARFFKNSRAFLLSSTSAPVTSSIMRPRPWGPRHSDLTASPKVTRLHSAADASSTTSRCPSFSAANSGRRGDASLKACMRMAEDLARETRHLQAATLCAMRSGAHQLKPHTTVPTQRANAGQPSEATKWSCAPDPLVTIPATPSPASAHLTLASVDSMARRRMGATLRSKTARRASSRRVQRAARACSAHDRLCAAAGGGGEGPSWMMPVSVVRVSASIGAHCSVGDEDQSAAISSAASGLKALRSVLKGPCGTNALWRAVSGAAVHWDDDHPSAPRSPLTSERRRSRAWLACSTRVLNVVSCDPGACDPSL